MEKPNVLLVPDTRGWSFDRIASAINKYLSNKYNFIIKFDQESNAQTFHSIKDIDLVVIFGWAWGVPKRIEGIFNKDKVVIGVYDEYFYKKFIEKFTRTLGRCSGLFVANEKIRQEIGKIFNIQVPIYLTMDGVDLDEFCFLDKNPKDNFVVGFAGNQDWAKYLVWDWKGFYDFIQPAVRETKCQLYSTGSRGNKIPAKDMSKEFYSQIDCLVCMSKGEGTPNPVLEAMASGVPVITTDVGIVSCAIKDGVSGFVIDRDKEKLKETILLLKNDKRLYQEIRINARKEVEKNWGWDKRVLQFDKMFEDRIKHPLNEMEGL